MELLKKNIIKVYDYKNDIEEEYQAFEIKFTFAEEEEKNFNIFHPWVKCKDFLQDVIKAKVDTTTNYKEKSIYGFRIDTDVNIKSKNLILLVKYGNNAKNIDDQMKNAVTILNHFEKNSKINKTILKKLEIKNKYYYVFYFDKVWLTSPVLISAYTLLIRFSFLKENFKTTKSGIIKDFESIIKKSDKGIKDVKHLDSIYKYLHKILTNRIWLFKKEDNEFEDTYTNSESIKNFHNRSGVVSLVKGDYINKNVNERMKKLINEE